MSNYLEELKYSIRRGYLEVVKILWPRINTDNFSDCKLVETACDYGHLRIVSYLVSHGAPIDRESIIGAIYYGHLNIVKYLVFTGLPFFDRDILYTACRKGHLNILKFLINNGHKIGSLAIRHASEKGHIHIVKYLYEEKKQKISLFSILWAHRKGHKDLVEYLVLNGGPYNSNQEFHIDIVRSLKKEYKRRISNLVNLRNLPENLENIIMSYILKPKLACYVRLI